MDPIWPLFSWHYRRIGAITMEHNDADATVTLMGKYPTTTSIFNVKELTKHIKQ